ncbi:hypothetical protein MKX03_017905 [Papaver bracteatum]|nr:hypothetical protein MKX03_017905 [Papaver bracteatum]
MEILSEVTREYKSIHSEITTEVKLLSEKYGKACAEIGIKSFNVDLPEQSSEAEVIAKVHELNANLDVHGILLQLLLPSHIGEENVSNEASIEKDVDGFHPLNIGKLAMKGREPLFQPCTPKGCLELLSWSGISVKGKGEVVIGKSNIGGLPVSLLLLKADATVTIVLFRAGAADSESIILPGGVGPMTVAMLLRNTLDGAKHTMSQYIPICASFDHGLHSLNINLVCHA